jgi:hypothetical protein
VLDQINEITRHPGAQAQSGNEPEDDEQEGASQVQQYKPTPGPPVRPERPHGEQEIVGGVRVRVGAAEVGEAAKAGGEAGAGEEGLPVAGGRKRKADRKPRSKRRCKQCMDFGGEGVDATKCRGAAGAGSCETFEKSGARNSVHQIAAAD